MPRSRYDTVVIGSGFGGAVVAARLAQAGRSVCLLEQGRRWSAGDFPRTFGQSVGAVWDGDTGFGFLQYRVFARQDVLSGVGVGGGSLVYFNVQLRAPDAIFDRPEWPRAVTGPALAPYYDRVEDVVRPRPLAPPAGESLPPRTQTFLRAAEGAGYDGSLLPIAVHTGPARNHPVSGLAQQPCDYGAGCLLGCRARAKNSLDMTYLPLGERHGLEIRPLHQAERIVPLAGGDGYAVHGRRRDPADPAASEPWCLEARTVVLSAGSVGTTELLLRAKSLHRSLPGLSPALGRRFSNNGDMIFAATTGAATAVNAGVGPSITAGAFVQAPGSPHVIMVQDLGYPPALMSLLDGTLPFPGRLRSLAHAGRGYVAAARHGAAFPAQALFGGSVVPRFLPYLGLGTDAADGRFRLDEAGRLRLDADAAASRSMYREMEDAMRRMSRAVGGRYVRSLLWRWPTRRLLTAHPLGGAVMSDRPEAGVVDDRGEVWGYPGLFVSDASVIPGPLAVNPSLTIAALGERVADAVLGR